MAIDKMDLKKYLEKQGYTNLKVIDGKVCGLFRFIYTTGLVVDLDDDGYKYRYCFDNHAAAIKAIEGYEDIEVPPTGNWIKRKGEGGDIRNPNYVNTNED